MFVRQLRNMILYAMAITKAARCRDESRGAHAKIVLKSDYDAMTAEQKEKLVGVENIKFAADGRGHDADDELVFFKRDDSRFMKTTVINYDPATEEPIVIYEEFEHSLIKARPRNYAVAKKE